MTVLYNKNWFCLLLNASWFFSCWVVSSSFVTPWTVACQTPLSMGFSRWDYCNGLSSSFARGLPDPEIELWSPALAGKLFTAEPPGKHQNANTYRKKNCLNFLSHLYLVWMFSFFFKYILVNSNIYCVMAWWSFWSTLTYNVSFDPKAWRIIYYCY